MVVIVISSGSTAAIGMVMVKVATVVIVAVFVVTFGLVVVCVVAVTIIVGAIYATGVAAIINGVAIGAAASSIVMVIIHNSGHWCVLAVNETWRKGAGPKEKG